MKTIRFFQGGLNWHADLSAYYGSDYSAMPTPLSTRNTPAQVREYYEKNPVFQTQFKGAKLVIEGEE